MLNIPLHWLLALLAVVWGQASAEPVTLRFGVLSIAPPARIHANWQPFTHYLSAQLGQAVAIVVPRGFGKMRAAAANNEVDIFYVNSHVFYRLHKEGKATGLAQMQNIAGKVTSRSEIYVRADSGIESVKQLKGKRIAYISPMGAGGYLAPRAWLLENGVDDTREIFTRNLSNSIHQVLLGDVEAGTMCGVNYRLMSRKVDTGELKVIGASEEYPENLVAARASLDPALQKRIRTILIEMDHTPAGRKVLEQMHGMKIRRFLPYDPATITRTEKLLEEAQLNP